MNYIIAVLIALSSAFAGGLTALMTTPSPVSVTNVTHEVAPAPSVKVGAVQNTKFVGTLPTTLSGAGITTSAASIGVASLTLKQSGYLLTMADFGSAAYLTLEPGNSSRQEFASCTGITQNANGTAVFTTCTRGLAPIYPYTASTTFAFTHSGGTTVIVSNSPPFYSNFTVQNNDANITGNYVFSQVPHVSSTTVDADITNATTSLVTYNLLSNTSFAGTVNASEVVKGIVELGTAIEQASSTASGSTGAGLVTQAKYASSSPTVGCNGTATVGALCSIVSRNDGKINPNYIATSSTDTYNWGATQNFNATTTFTASTSFTGSLLLSSILINAADYFSTTTTGTWTKPTWTTASSTVMVECWAGGGGGGASTGGGATRAGGGGGGAYLSRVFKASDLTSTVAITIGAGGAGGAAGANNGTSGGTTSFGAFLLTYGGGGGGYGNSAGNDGSGGGGGGALAGGGTGGNGGAVTAGGGPGAVTTVGQDGYGGGFGSAYNGGTVGDSGFGGGGGGHAVAGGASIYGGGGGGGANGSGGGASSFGGNGGTGGNTSNGIAGTVPGGGGGGASGASFTGGAGAGGKCNVLTYR